MALPISGSQFDKLGVRLRDSSVIAIDDLDLLERVLGSYDDALTEVSDVLHTLGYEPTTRLKTTETLLDKLRRTAGLTIRGIHDIAGARLVLDGGRFKQDQMVARIVDAFSRGAKPPLVLDRRAKPSFGYRAVHVIAFIDKLPVEVQVRTDLQHRWAEIMERLGDRWGRGMRYGLGPDDPDKTVFSGGSLSTTRTDFTDSMMRWSEMIDRFEQLGLEIAALHSNSGQATPEIRALYDESCTMEDGLREKLIGLLGSAQREGEAS